MSETCPVCNNPLEEGAAACPSCGFKLLGSTQRFKPVALAEEAIPAPEKPHEAASLRVIRGPQTEMVFAIGDAPLIVGRSPQCDVFLNDMTVSREHATVEPGASGVVIRDANSFNGVWVNNENVDARVLKAGDVVQIGAFCLLYQEG